MKKLVLLILSAVLLAVTLSVTAVATDDKETIIINTAEELMAVKSSGSYWLRSDIDMSGYEWEGIEEFSGTFRGDGNTIRNFTSDRCGLFETLRSGAKITGVKLENAFIVTDTKYLGGIASYIPASAENVTISDCSANGKIATHYNNAKSSLNYCGGIVGINKSTSTLISDCVSGAEVEANYGAGGICGLNYGEILQCSFTGKVCCVRNDHEICSCPVEDGEIMHSEIFNIGKVCGGICAVNYGSVTGCASRALFGFDSLYAGSINGITVKSTGSASGCFVVKSYREQSNDEWHYDELGTILSAKKLKTIR